MFMHVMNMSRFYVYADRRPREAGKSKVGFQSMGPAYEAVGRLRITLPLQAAIYRCNNEFKQY